MKKFKAYFYHMSVKTHYLLAVNLVIIPIKATNSIKSFTIMLEPAGDAKHTGREVDDCFERGITLQCAEKLKLLLEKEYPNIKVILTRFPGESLETLQNANFANRLAVDLYLSIHFYQEHDAKPQLFLYQCAYHPAIDFWKYTPRNLSFIPYHQAHQENANISKAFGTIMLQALQEKKFANNFDVKGFFSVPFKPLVGIKSPALALEASLKSKKDWSLFIEPLAHSIGMISKEVLQ